MKKPIYMTIAWLSLSLGIVGIVVPVLPTTPFLLLSAFCFEKSSEKFHAWLLENKVFGKYIRDYQEKKGISLRNKIIAIATMGLGMSYSAYKVPHPHARIALLLIFIAVSIHICKLKTLK